VSRPPLVTATVNGYGDFHPVLVCRTFRLKLETETVRQFESPPGEQLLVALKDVRSQLRSVQQQVQGARAQLRAVQSRVDALSSKVSGLVGSVLLVTGGILSALTAVAGYNSVKTLLNRT